MINFYKRTNTFSPLYIYIANNCLVPLTCILANNFANNFVTKLNNRAFSSSSLLFVNNSTRIDIESNGGNSSSRVSNLCLKDFYYTECFEIENFFILLKEVREKSSEFPYSGFF